MGQKQTKMNALQLTILTAVNMMGSGIIMLPTNLAQVGTMSILSWLVTALGSVALAYGFAQCGIYSRKGGGMGGYSEYAFGKAGAFMANYTYSLSLLISNVAIAITAVGYATVFLGVTLSPINVCLWTIILLWLTTVLNFGGARITGRIGAVTVWGVIIPVVAVSIIGWFWFDPHRYVTSWNPHHYPLFSGIGKSIAITLWAFLGLESASANMDAVENPEKNVPIAVLGGTLGAAVVYILSTNVIAGIVPNLKLVDSNAPFGLAFATMFTPVVGQVVMALMVIACAGSLLGWQFTIAQVFKSSAVEGYFPKVFTKITKTETPLVGMVILCIVQTLLALMTISPTLNKQFNVLVNLAVVTNMIPYILSMGAVMVMQKASSVPARKANIANFVALIAAIYSLYALYGSGEVAMTYGSIATFAGWTLYGFISHRFDLEKNTVLVSKKAS